MVPGPAGAFWACTGALPGPADAFCRWPGALPGPMGAFCACPGAAGALPEAVGAGCGWPGRAFVLPGEPPDLSGEDPINRPSMAAFVCCVPGACRVCSAGLLPGPGAALPGCAAGFLLGPAGAPVPPGNSIAPGASEPPLRLFFTGVGGSSPICAWSPGVLAVEVPDLTPHNPLRGAPACLSEGAGCVGMSARCIPGWPGGCALGTVPVPVPLGASPDLSGVALSGCAMDVSSCVLGGSLRELARLMTLPWGRRGSTGVGGGEAGSACSGKRGVGGGEDGNPCSVGGVP